MHRWLLALYVQQCNRLQSRSNLDSLHAWPRHDLVAVLKYCPDFFAILQRLQNMDDVTFAGHHLPAVGVSVRQAPSHILYQALLVVIDGSDDANNGHGLNQKNEK